MRRAVQVAVVHSGSPACSCPVPSHPSWRSSSSSPPPCPPLPTTCMVLPLRLQWLLLRPMPRASQTLHMWEFPSAFLPTLSSRRLTSCWLALASCSSPLTWQQQRRLAGWARQLPGSFSCGRRRWGSATRAWGPRRWRSGCWRLPPTWRLSRRTTGSTPTSS